MLIFTSPAKTQDFLTPWSVDTISEPMFQKETIEIVQKIKKMTHPQLSRLLHTSEKLTSLNFERYKNWHLEVDKSVDKPAILAYIGDIYKQMTPHTYSVQQQQYAQDSVRIITGLYGMLQPYDLIQPYRLEMNAQLSIKKKKNLYDFWRERLTNAVGDQVNDSPEPHILLNLASKEYASAIDFAKLEAPYYEVVFKQIKGNKSQVIGILAKKARGVMLDYLIKEKADSLEKILAFQDDGYKLINQSKNKIIFEKKLY